MADVIEGTQQEFWRAPSVAEAAGASVAVIGTRQLADVCAGCSGEFLIGAKFCHACGLTRPVLAEALAAQGSDAAIVAGVWLDHIAWANAGVRRAATAWRRIPFPAWLRYLHFHEIKRWVGLPTAALIAFIVGLGCLAGVLGVSVFYKASNLAEFQAIQLWRIEWLLAATASFVAGILLKKPNGPE